MALIRKNYKNKKGLTLLELAVTTATFGIFSLMLVALISATVRNYSRTQYMQDVRAQTNFALKNMQIDITKAILLPPPGDNWSEWIPSGVLIPNAYGNDGNALITDEDGNISASGVPIADPSDDGSKDITGNGRADNRLLMVMANTELRNQRIQEPVLFAEQDLCLIEYVVPQGRENVLERRTYRVQQLGNSYTGFSTISGRWLVTPGTFTEESTLWIRTDVIARLSGDIDTIFFSIRRPIMTFNDGQYGTWYDRNFMTIHMEMTRHIGDDPNLPITYSETTETSVAAR